MTARSRHVCPICGEESHPRHARSGREPSNAPGAAAPDNPSYPFCSPQCKLVDLGAWLDGTYRIPGPPASLGDADTDEADALERPREEET